jgi:hypothetical protein
MMDQKAKGDGRTDWAGRQPGLANRQVGESVREDDYKLLAFYPRPSNPIIHPSIHPSIELFYHTHTILHRAAVFILFVIVFGKDGRVKNKLLVYLSSFERGCSGGSGPSRSDLA